MSDNNKTEQPTDKKLYDARKKGNFRFSEFIVQLTTLITGSAMVYYIMAGLPQHFDRILDSAIHLSFGERFETNLANFLIILLKETLIPASMIFGTVAFFSVVGNIVQVGFVFQGSKFKKGMNAINPVTNLKNLFSKQTLTNLFMSIVKVFIICFVAYKTIIGDIGLVDTLYRYRLDVLGATAHAGGVVWHICMVSLFSLLPVALLDFGLKHLFYKKDNMMSKDEVKREHKESEGNPEVKAQRKAIGREMIESPNRLAGASAVIRNPTHIAVVVRYEPSSAPVPYVSQMEEGNLAKMVIEQAREMGVPLYEDIPLARALYANAKINHHIPLEFSEQIVPFIYWLQNNHPEHVFHQPEFTEDTIARIGDVKR